MKKANIKMTITLMAIIMIMLTIVTFRNERSLISKENVQTNEYLALASNDLISSVTIGGNEATYSEEKGVFYLTAYVDEVDKESEIVITRKNSEYVVTLTDKEEADVTLTGSKLKLTGKVVVGEYILKVSTKTGNSTKTYNLVIARSNRLDISCDDTTLLKDQTTSCTVKVTNDIKYEEMEKLSFDITTDASKLITSSITVSKNVEKCFKNTSSSNSGKVSLQSTGKCDEDTLAQDTVILEFKLTSLVNVEGKSNVQATNISSDIKFSLAKPLEIKLAKIESNSNLKGAPTVTYEQNGTKTVTLVATNDNKSFYGYVPSDVTKVNIAASAESGSVSGAGEKKLSSDDNEFTITVTAKDNTKAEYKIKLTTVPKVVETRLSYIKVNDKSLSLGTSNVYNVSVPKEDKTVVIKAKAKDNGLIISPNDVGAEELTIVKPLVDGANEFEIVVASVTGEKQTFKVVVTRTSTSNSTTQGDSSTLEEEVPNEKNLIEISPKTTVKAYISKNGNVVVTDKNGKTITGDTVIGTGATIKNGNKTSIVYVSGDVTGDGLIDIADVTKLYQFIHNVIKMDDCYVKAGLVTTNETPAVNDVAKLYQYVSKKISEL